MTAPPKPPGSVAGPEEITRKLEHRQFAALSMLTGLPPNRLHAPTMSLHENTQGFARYLDVVGVRWITWKEMLIAHQRDVAIGLGYPAAVLLPRIGIWHRGALCALVADKMRDAAGGSVVLRNWYRPADYNRAVGGAKASDHVGAYAVDLDFQSAKARRRAVEDVIGPLWETGQWELSIGVGHRTVHLGIMAGRGQRSWKYGKLDRRPGWMR